MLEVERNNLNFDYKLKGTSLEHVDNEKDTGVTIDSKLKFKDHMNEKIKRETVLWV